MTTSVDRPIDDAGEDTRPDDGRPESAGPEAGSRYGPETGSPYGPGAGLPLTAAQTGMWLSHMLDPESPALNTAEYLEIEGPLDPAALREAVRRGLAECDALWVQFLETPEGTRQLPVRPADDGFPLHERDLRGEPDPDRAARAWMDEDLLRPCDPTAGPPFGTALLRTGEERTLWYLRVHHAVMDGYGYSLVAGRVADIYTSLLQGADAGPGPFGHLRELVAEDAEYRASPAYGTDRAHWVRALAGAEDSSAAERPALLPSSAFHRSTARLDADAAGRMRELAASLRATWPEVLIAVQALTESRETGNEDVVLGVPMMCRTGSVALRTPGMVMNVLPLRLRVTPRATFAELTRQVVLGLRSLRRHQRYRYEDIRRDTGAQAGGRPLTGPLVNAMPFDHSPDFAGTPARVHNLSAGPVEHLTVNVRGDGRGLSIDHDANPALYDETEVARRQARFVELVERLTGTDPHLPLASHAIVTAAERETVLEEFNDTAVPTRPTTLLGPFEARAATAPRAPALVADGRTLDYGELNAQANRLARELALLGVRPGSLVGVALPRSVHLVVGLLAVLKAGGAYLPLDTDHPTERLRGMLEDAGVWCVLTDSATAGLLPDTAVPVLPLDVLDVSAHLHTTPGRPLTPQHPAYVIYTSGSTGRPKGVVVPHSAIDNRLRWMQAQYGLGPGDRVLQKTPSGFDVSVWEFFWPLREGATLVMAEPGEHRDPAALARTIREQGISTVHFVPSMLQEFLAEPGVSADAAGLRRVFCSGEALPRDTADRFHRLLPDVPLFNLYGPTEAAVDVTHHPCVAGESGPVPIGRPVWNTRLYVLDAALQPCPPGVPGELYLAGAQLATGYLGRPELTAARFVADPFAAARGETGARMYRTGDVARWRDDGAVEYLGRTDTQVKLSGLRIELGEIEAALTDDPGVRAACVVVREDRPGDQRLVGYVVPSEQLRPPGAEPLRSRLAARLPAHMVPGALVTLDALPLSPNGKLDRKALPAPENEGTGNGPGRPPGTLREETLTRVFAEVLGLPKVGADDGFFDLGGTSLLAIRLMARVREETGARLSVASLFERPTPAALAAGLDGGFDDSGALEVLLPLRDAGSERPLFVVHPAGGLGWCYSGLLAPLGADQPVIAVQARGLVRREPLPGSMTEMAADYAAEIRKHQPRGPYRLLGWSVGGVVAHAVAVLLREAGEEVELLALMDAYPADQWRGMEVPQEADALKALLRMAGFESQDGELERAQVLERLREEGSALAGLPEETLTAVTRIVVNNARLMREHEHARFDGDMVFFTATAPRSEDWLRRDAWRPYVSGGILNHDLPCLHHELTRPEQIQAVASVIAGHLRGDAG
ncbi:enterobactin synthetase component F [Streptomyces sp. WMMB 714]|uniref:non-ribosomal peptide synthetase n=1 Tax=Streptomyces sp. WMMB 714 TaxID=1286822 RepID=UPI000823A6F6|nr:non-ribosomal peptide synthetase [Streptomyces sp. WMMB 714]SCK39913.1 enterobactin synthetase component F [Streptomyces sp. WMMB 714]